MKASEIREGDIVEIDYITEFTKEHINEGKALVIWKGFNNQPLVRKLSTKITIWDCYEHIAKVIGHIDLEDYMDKALQQEPCKDAISRQAVLDKMKERDEELSSICRRDIRELPPVTPQPRIGHWIDTGSGQKCSECEEIQYGYDNFRHFCANCGAKMVEQESEDSDDR